MPLNLLPAKSFEDLIVWQKGHEFVVDVYKIFTPFPRRETYGLLSQMRKP
jgi:hypothetical protein